MVDKKISSELIYRSTDTLIILGIVLLASVYSRDNIGSYLAAGLGASLIFGLVGRFTDIYGSWSGRPFFRDEVMRTVVTWLTTFLFLVFIIFATNTSGEYLRSVLIGWLFITPVLLVTNRYLLRVLQAHLKSLGINNKTIAVVGATEQGIQFANALQTRTDAGFQVAGFYTFEDNEQSKLPNNYAHIGNVETMLKDARSGQWDQIYLALPSEQNEAAASLINKLSDSITPIRMIPDDFTHSLVHSKYMEIADTPVFCIYDAPLSLQSSFVKRIEDIVGGAILLTLSLPVMAIIAIAVKTTSPGPVLFKQTRHGLRGKPFSVWKFRTMTVCENGSDVKQATRNDLRITRIGRFLRRSSLDELPQFFNVLQGHMSIVGPRPHAVAHNEEYRERIPGYMLRHLMKPGITGWAQVNGWRGETDTLHKMQKRVECDMEYIRSWSLGFDLKIIFVTAFKTLFDKNAY